MERLAAFIYRLRAWLFSAVILAGVFFAANIRFEMNNKLDAWFEDDDPVSVDFRLFRDTFEGGDSLIVGLESENLFTRENLAYLVAKTDELETVDHVRYVVSLANANRVRGTEQGIDVRPLLEGYERTPPREIRRAALEDELFADYLVSKDGRMTALYVVFDEIDSAHVDEIIAQVRAVMDRGKPASLEVFLSGGLMVSSEFVKATRQNQTLLPALGIAIGILTIYVLFRSFSRIVIVTVVVGLSLVWTLGLHSLMGYAFNPISGMIIPLVVVLSLSNSIHMMEYYDEVRKAHAPGASFLSMVRFITVPCFIASITTSLGLFSLMTSPIRAVKQFGFTSGAGIFFSFLISLFVVPFLLTVTPDRRGREHRWWGRSLSLVAHANERRHWLILVITLLLTVASAVGMGRVTIDSNELEWFPEDSELRKNAMKFDRALSGIGNVELVLVGEPGMLMDPKVLSGMDRLSRRIERMPNVRKAISLADYIKAVNRTLKGGDETHYRVPDTTELIAQEALLFSMSQTGREEIERYANIDNSVGRISVRLKYTSSAEVRELVSRIRSEIANVFPDGGVRVGLTGFSFIFSMIDKYIVESQIRSFSLAFVLVFGVMFLVMWSVRYGALAIIPNVLPVMFIIGFMGWTGINLNVGTVMIASVALGIAVDDTTHLISRFRREYDHPGATLHRALRQSIIRVGRAMVFTSLIAVCGFCVVVLSEFQPARDFGVLLSFTLVIALICDMFLLPSMIIVLRRFLLGSGHASGDGGPSPAPGPSDPR